MKRILLGLVAAVSFVAFTASVARADDKPATDGTTAPAKKTHHKKKKAAEGDKAAAGSTTTTTK